MTRFITNEEKQRRLEARQRASNIVINMDKPPVVYARQSTKDQPIKNKEAKAMQTDDLLDLAEERGWNRSVVLLFVENYYDQYGKYDEHGKVYNASGKLRIDKRPGLQHVVYLIETDQISAVICREISRLFRDETLIVATMFADVCKRHHVVIITPHHVYDFNAEERGDFNRFIEDAKVAAAYLKNMREVVSAAKHRKGARGKYSGHAVPTGLMLTEDRMGYEPNPYWAHVVRDITHRYRQLDADLAALRRELFGKCLFPDLPPEIAARVGKVYLEKVVGGYTIKSRTGLVGILTNVANIGHMHFDGEIVKRDVHKAIVDVDDYLFAVYHLQDVDLDGNPINRPERAIRLPQKGNDNPRDGLLSGVRSNGRPVLSTDQGYVYLYQRLYGAADACYTIKNGSAMSLGQYTGSIFASTLDGVFEAQLMRRLDDLFYLVRQKQIHESQGSAVYESDAFAEVAADLDRGMTEQEDQAGMVIDHFHAVRQEVALSLAGVDTSIAELKRQIAVCKQDLDMDRVKPPKDQMDPADREDVYRTLKNLRADLAALERKKKDAGKMIQAIEDTSRKILTARDYWPDMSLEQKKTFIRLVTQDILLHDTGIGFMEMTVTWVSLMGIPQVERAYIMQQNGSAANWTDEEIAMLVRCYPHGTKREIIHLLHNRSWRSCITKASRLGIERHTRRQEDTGISNYVSLDAHCYMAENGLGEVENGVWWRSVSAIKQSSEAWRQGPEQT
jgi:DNA invertase Pin-like site-specific DNA recombinase